MGGLFDWYATLSALERGFALTATAATTFLFLQTGMQIVGLSAQGLSEWGDNALDSDGVADGIDLDGDGVADGIDMDGDGILDGFDLDGDGIADGIDMDGDGIMDGFDLDGDGIADSVDLDGDGVPDAISVPHTASAPASHPIDFDDDMPNSREVLQNEPNLRLFTMRGMVAFFAIGGWSGLIALQRNVNLFVAFGMAFAAGAAGAYVVAKVLQVFLRLQDKGNVDLENAIGMRAEVYLRIPAKAAHPGKITLILQERFVEVNAITKGEEELARGRIVRIVGMQDDDTLIVRALD